MPGRAFKLTQADDVSHSDSHRRAQIPFLGRGKGGKVPGLALGPGAPAAGKNGIYATLT